MSLDNHLRVLVRVFVIVALNLLGCLNLPALFSHAPAPRKRVAFQAYSIHLAQFYQPVISELLQSSQDLEVQFLILLHPHFPLGDAYALKAYAHSQLHLDNRDIKFHWQALWEHFDLVLYSDVYAQFQLRKSKTCLLAHGPGLGERFFVGTALRKSVTDFDLVLVNGDYDCEMASRFVHSEKLPFSKVYPVGLPFLDVLAHSGVSGERYLSQIHLDPDRQTVLFAPHWTTLAAIENDDNNRFDRVVSVLSTLDVNIVIKLHACSMNRVMGGSIDWQAKLAQFSDAPNVWVDRDVDDLPALAHADVLITDNSSRAFNFMLLGKPVILYSPPRLEPGDIAQNRMNLMRRGAFVAETPSELKLILEEVILRGAVQPAAVDVSRECFSNFGNATRVTVELLERELYAREGESGFAFQDLQSAK